MHGDRGVGAGSAGGCGRGSHNESCSRCRRVNPPQVLKSSAEVERGNLSELLGGQAVYILDKIAAAIEALGGTMDDVVQTRVWLRDANDWEAVGRVHGRVFAEARPANTLVEVGRLVGSYLVEIEVEAIVD